jgi:hypothetical protein
MATSKTAGETKAKAGAAAKKKAAPKATAAKKAAPKKSKPATKAAPKTATPKAGVKKAAPKKVAAPKLSPTQQEVLEMIFKSGQPYLAEKKPDQKVVEALLKHKLVKKTGKKDEKTKSFHVALSQAGQKFLKSSSAPSPKA